MTQVAQMCCSLLQVVLLATAKASQHYGLERKNIAEMLHVPFSISPDPAFLS